MANASHEKFISSGAAAESRIENPFWDLLVMTYLTPFESIVSASASVVEALRVTLAETTGASMYAVLNETSTFRDPFSIRAIPPISLLKYGRPINSTSELIASKLPIEPI